MAVASHCKVFPMSYFGSWCMARFDRFVVIAFETGGKMSLAKVTTVDEAVTQALKEIAKGDPDSPLSLNDHLTQVGLRDPYQRALALRLLRLRLKPGGSHWELTEEKRWAFEREPWAKAAGLKKGRQELTFEAETATTRSLLEAVNQSEHLPDAARDAVGHIRNLLATRANRKLDETSAAVVGESVEDLVHELEMQGRLLDEKGARIQQAERHNEQLRQQSDRLLALMERLTGPSFAGNNAMTLGRETSENEQGGVRSRNN
jgi:hypothetical protein